jgi:hypothetical protein
LAFWLIPIRNNKKKEVVVLRASSDTAQGGDVTALHGNHSLGYVLMALANHPGSMYHQVMQAVGCPYGQAKPG